MPKHIKTAVQPHSYAHALMGMETRADINSFIGRCSIKKPGYLQVIAEMARIHLTHKQSAPGTPMGKTLTKKLVACQEENRQLRRLVRMQAEYIANAKP